jgi:hypothetical protein
MKKMTGVLSLAVMASLWSASAQAQNSDMKTLNGAACETVVAASGAPSSQYIVTPSGRRDSNQPGSSATAPPRPPLMFVCPLVRDDHNPPYPVEVSVRVNTFNALSMPDDDFSCALKIVDQQGNVVDQTANVIMGVGFSSKVLSAPLVAVNAEHAYVLTCLVPNVTFGQRSGIISYKWSELSFF